MSEYKFKCPNPHCNGDKLNEIMIDVTVDSEIDMITDDDGIVYGDQTNEDGKVFYFCCRDCGTVLTTDQTAITTRGELIKWLKNANHRQH